MGSRCASSSRAEYTDDGNYLKFSWDALGKQTKYGYNVNTGTLDWVQYPEDTEQTRTNYTYDDMYRMATAACTTNTGKSMSAGYTYTDDYLTSIQTPTTTYNFTYGDFGLRESVKIGSRTLATYNYTEEAVNDRKYDLDSLDYGNGDKVEYEYDDKGRVIKQTYDDGDHTVSYAYDNNGALAKVKDSATGRTTTYYYDLTDRMMKYVEKGTDFSHSVGYEYDTKNNLTQLVEEINGTKRTTSYTYDDDNRVSSVTTDGTTVHYTYDDWGRLDTKVTGNGSGTTVLTEEYTFVETTLDGVLVTSSQISTYKVTAGGTVTTYTYTYDDNGNITSINDGTKTITYTYDSANQLRKEECSNSNTVTEWMYDNNGNIIMEDSYSISSDDIGIGITLEYSYGESGWGDLMTGGVSYDPIGNPESYKGWELTWEHGRQLAKAQKNNVEWTYTYNADGLRTSKTNDVDTWNYVYNGSQLTQLTKGTDTLYFTYDASGTPLTVKYNGTTYYYATNIQGDVVAILGADGTQVVTYSYDAWGSPKTPDGSMASNLGALNPLRYRGYVFDQETGLYYLQSRYYDPAIGRFLNADAFASTGQGLTGNNMFAYCNNNPISCSDSQGTRPVSILESFGDKSISVPSRAKKETKIDKLVKQTTITKRTVDYKGTMFVTYDVAISSDAFLMLSEDWNEIGKYATSYADVIYLLTENEALSDKSPKHMIMSANHIYSELMAHLCVWDMKLHKSAEIANLNVDEDRGYVFSLMVAFGYTGEEHFIYGD